MNLTTKQKDLLIGMLENFIDNFDMDESMEFGEDARIILSEAEKIVPKNEDD